MQWSCSLVTDHAWRGTLRIELPNFKQQLQRCDALQLHRSPITASASRFRASTLSSSTAPCKAAGSVRESWQQVGAVPNDNNMSGARGCQSRRDPQNALTNALQTSGWAHNHACGMTYWRSAQTDKPESGANSMRASRARNCAPWRTRTATRRLCNSHPPLPARPLPARPSRDRLPSSTALPQGTLQATSALDAHEAAQPAVRPQWYPRVLPSRQEWMAATGQRGRQR